MSVAACVCHLEGPSLAGLFRILVSVELAQPPASWHLPGAPKSAERTTSEVLFRRACDQALDGRGVSLEDPFVDLGERAVRSFQRALGYTPAQTDLVVRFSDGALLLRLTARAPGGEIIVVYAVPVATG